MLVMYFSIVRRNAACASRVRASASLMITTIAASASYSRSRPTEFVIFPGVERTFEALLCIQVDLLRLRNLL
jgi:hypothetical protein